MDGVLQRLINGNTFEKGVFVTICGMLGVFAVLILFYLLAKVMLRLFPYKPEEEE